VDTVPPEVLVTVEPGNTVTRTVTVVASDASAEVAAVRLSNDPRMLEGVVTLAGMDTVTWIFDERQVVWVQVEDTVGNTSEPYGIYAPMQSMLYLPIINAPFPSPLKQGVPWRVYYGNAFQCFHQANVLSVHAPRNEHRVAGERGYWYFRCVIGCRFIVTFLVEITTSLPRGCSV
jgi:hypothetical protein